jgi:hypothetical protein
MSMSPATPLLPYNQLVAAADRIFEDCEDDVQCIALQLGKLDTELRSELLVSDILNAFQTFYYYFRILPDGLVREQLELEPASSVVNGLKIDEIEFLELIFLVKDNEPVIRVTNGEETLATFTGRSAYAEGMKYLENPEYTG